MRASKPELIARLVKRIDRGIEHTALAQANARQAAIDAPGAMQSRYDSSKEEQGYLADSLSARVNQKATEAARLRGLPLPEDSFIVQEGSLVRLEDVAEQRFVDYLVLPCCGGERLETGNGDITVVTPESPIGKSMFGLDIGEPFSVTVGKDQKAYRVANVS